MLKKSLFCLIFLLSFATVSIHADNSQFYNVKEKSYFTGTVFELASKNKLVGTVVKSRFRVRTNYDLYDAKGNYEATAVCRVLTLGLFYEWATEMDVYDSKGNRIGVIDGQAVTMASAKFSFYDAKGQHVGIGYLDINNTGFIIVDPKNDYHVLAQYTRRFVENTIDSWDVAIFDQDQISPAMLHIFGAFAVDTQSAFQEDT